MARVISDSCISCGSCAAQCPVEAISQGDEHFVIDADTCIDCGACEAQCPVHDRADHRRYRYSQNSPVPDGTGLFLIFMMIFYYDLLLF